MLTTSHLSLPLRMTRPWAHPIHGRETKRDDAFSPTGIGRPSLGVHSAVVSPSPSTLAAVNLPTNRRVRIALAVLIAAGLLGLGWGLLADASRPSRIGDASVPAPLDAGLPAGAGAMEIFARMWKETPPVAAK